MNQVETADEYTLDIAGREVTLRSDEDPQRIREVEQLLNQRIAEMGGGKGVPLHNALLLAALHMADELINEQTRHNALKQKIRSRSASLLEKLDSLKFAA